MTEGIKSWFAVRVPRGREWDAHMRMGMDGLMPWLWYTVEYEWRGPSHARRHMPVLRAYFPGYIFAPSSRSFIAKIQEIEINRAHLQVVKTTDRSGQSKHLEISHKALLDLADELGCQRNGVVLKQERVLEAGRQIRVKHGPLADFLATVEATVPADGKSPVRALIDMLGRETPVTLKQGEIEVVS